eukprot:3705140-Rhodomonas_salina.1
MNAQQMQEAREEAAERGELPPRSSPRPCSCAPGTANEAVMGRQDGAMRGKNRGLWKEWGFGGAGRMGVCAPPSTPRP